MFQGEWSKKRPAQKNCTGLGRNYIRNMRWILLQGEIPPFAGMVEIVLDAADVSVQPGDIADVVVAEVLIATCGGTAPLCHVFKRHVAVVVEQLFERVFGENGFGRILGGANLLAALEETARIAVGGVLVVVGEAGQQAVNGTGRIVVDVTGDGAAEGLLVANIRVDADTPVEGVGAEGVFVVVVHVDGPATGVGIDDVRAGVDHDAFIVIRVHGESCAKLFAVADAGCHAGFFTGFGERGQQHGGENRNDGDDDQQFDQREVEESFHFVVSFVGFKRVGLISM